ncbi:hypothetical protein KKD62_00880 [Patescibacteria group bacterium]|nr:hypothetical protein [Patescibacteria group bacterium]MBU1931583.1 hypothetical protein [Patescibacteria group bacterium]
MGEKLAAFKEKSAYLGLVAVAIVSLFLSNCRSSVTPEVVATALATEPAPTATILLPTATLEAEVQVEDSGLPSCVLGIEPCDYCKWPDAVADEAVGDGEAEEAGEAAEPEWAIASISDPETIRQIQPGLDNLVYVGLAGAEPAKEGVNYVLVGSGFENQAELDAKMRFYTEMMNTIFKEVDINFYYLNLSVPIGVQHQGGLAEFSNLEETQLLFDKLNTLRQFNGMTVMVDSDEYFGRGRIAGLFSIAAVNEVYGLYLLIHETFHRWEITDRYLTFYDFPASELFVLDDEYNPILFPWIQPIYEKLQPPIVFTGNYCGGQKVYTFYGYDSFTAFNIMGYVYEDKAILRKLYRGEPILNGMQIESIREAIK